MARAERRRDARARTPAAPRHYESAYVGTEGLFFQRLRRRAKWVFLALALVFGLSFVVFGVGSNVQGGVADIIGLGSSGSNGQPSVDDAREKLDKNPNDVAALQELATAFQNEGRTAEAIVPLETLTGLRPRNQNALRQLAALYLTEANRQREALQTAQTEAFFLNPGGDFLPSSTSPFGQALGSPPITSAVTSEVNARINQLFSVMTGSYNQAKEVYVKLASQEPSDAALQIDLATTAQNAGDATTAIAAYKRFLKLAPEDPSAPQVRQVLQQLQAAAAQQAAANG